VIERVESYGMAVGREVLDTMFWAGRFARGWEDAGWGGGSPLVACSNYNYRILIDALWLFDLRGTALDGLEATSAARTPSHGSLALTIKMIESYQFSGRKYRFSVSLRRYFPTTTYPRWAK
jgi:hypothetical protein